MAHLGVCRVPWNSFSCVSMEFSSLLRLEWLSTVYYKKFYLQMAYRIYIVNLKTSLKCTMYTNTSMMSKQIEAYLKGLSTYRKMTFSFFEYLYLTLTFLYYSNWESNHVMKCPTKLVNTEYRISLEILKCSSNLAPEMFITNENKMTPVVLLPWQHFCCWFCLNLNWNSQFLS